MSSMRGSEFIHLKIKRVKQNKREYLSHYLFTRGDYRREKGPF